MDVFELLKKDHEKVSGIFDQLEGERDAARCEQLFTQLKQELDLHAQLEETLLYPELKQAAPTREITLEAYAEHQEVKDLLNELQSIPAGDEEWRETLVELRENVEHHVHEEEGEMFTQARQVLSRQQIDALGERISAAKQQRQRTATAG